MPILDNNKIYGYINKIKEDKFFIGIINLGDNCK